MDWLSAGIGIVGTITGVTGLVFAQFANREAKQSNSIAKRALAEAGEANRIAVEANKLAEDANSVSERALRVSGENFEYQWGFRIENDGVFCITNESSYDACDFTLFVEVQRAGKSIAAGDGLHREGDRISFGGELTFKIERIYPKLISEVRAQKRKVTAIIGDTVCYNGKSPVTFDVVAVLRWLTPAGRKCGDTLKYAISCREDNRGNIIFTRID